MTELIDRRLQGIEFKVDKHHRDLYEGNGKPSITTRIQVMEDTCDRITRSLQQITWLLVSTLLTAIASIIVGLVLKGK